MAFHVKSINNLSTVAQPMALSSKNFLLLSKIDTYNGEAEPTYEVYRISDKLLLRSYKPTIVEAAIFKSQINAIYEDFKKEVVKKQNRENNKHGESKANRGGMLDEVSGYMELREVVNDMAKMMRQEDLKSVTEQYVETSELSSVASELYARGEELAHEVMDYAGALGMALITAHGTPLQSTATSSNNDDND